MRERCARRRRQTLNLPTLSRCYGAGGLVALTRTTQRRGECPSRVKNRHGGRSTGTSAAIILVAFETFTVFALKPIEHGGRAGEVQGRLQARASRARVSALENADG